MLGNMYAKKETEVLNKTYASTELIFHFIVTLLFTITGILIIPFMQIYTKDFTDAEYILPAFGVAMSISQAVYCIRIPYEMMIQVAGHYKETQLSSFIEAAISIVLSIICILKFGLMGAAIGVTVALVYRTVYLAWYLSKNILYRSIRHFVLHIFVDLISMIVMILSTCFIKLKAINYLSWVFMAIQVGLICLVVSAIVNFVFYRNIFLDSMKQIIKRRKKAV